MKSDFYMRQLTNVIGEKETKRINNFNAFIAGGSILSIVTNKEVNDIDVYFKSIDDAFGFYNSILADNYFLFCETKKSLLLIDGVGNAPHYNLVLFDFFETPQDLFDSFDFTVCKAAFDGIEFYFDDDFFKDVASRSLIYTPSFRYPLSTALRIQKYENKGYTISRNEYIKILLQVTQRNIKSIDDLEEELCGIYGINLSEHFKDMKDFSIDNVISHMDNIHYDITTLEDRLNIDKSVLPECFKDVFDVIEISNGKIISLHKLEEYAGNKKALEFPLTMYKWVKKDKDRYLSHFKSNVEYKINEITVDKKPRGFNVLFESKINSHFYKNKEKSVKIKLLITDRNHLSVHNGELTATHVINLGEC